MSLEIEQNIITALLKDNSKIAEITTTADQFENSAMRQVFIAIKTMLANRAIADVITVSEYLGSDRDWLTYISEMMIGAVGSTHNIKAYATVLEREHRVNQAKSIGEWLKMHSTQEGAVQEAIRKLMSLSSNDESYEYDLKGMIKRGLEEIERAFNSKGEIIGLGTGVQELNEALGGFHPGDLVFICGRPAIGKTAVLLNMLMGAKEKVGCISGEQGVTQVAQRILSMKSKVKLSRMRNGSLDEVDWSNLNNGTMLTVAHPGIWTFDKSSPSIEEIESSARKWKFEHDIKGLYVDYLQKIKRDKNKNKSEAIGDNASYLKDMARELQIPVVCLAQVKREVDTRVNKRPMMSDISDTSEAEKEADVVICLYRDEVYNPDSPDAGVIELNVEKNRHGPTGRIRAAWDGQYLSVTDLEIRNNG